MSEPTTGTRFTLTNSLINESKKAWGHCLCAFFKFNVEQIKDCFVNDNFNLVINGNEYKFDVSEYTGSEERYVFFNPVSGRLYIEANGIKKIYKFEVALFDENEF